MNINNLPSSLFYRFGCYMLSFAAMAYLTFTLSPRLKADFFSHLPDVGLWFVGLLFFVMIFANGKTHQVLNIVPLIGLAGLVLIF